MNGKDGMVEQGNGRGNAANRVEARGIGIGAQGPAEEEIIIQSVLQDEKKCWICGSMVDLERHHIMSGTANRKLSERYGLWCYLCYRHHTGPGGAQYNRVLNRELRMYAQMAFERTHTREEWMKVFGKNYL